MSIINDAINYIEQSKLSLLTTIGEDNAPYVRPIGAFANNGVDIYFTTAKNSEKVKHINANPIVTFYFQNEGQSYESFKNASVIGEAIELSSSEEFDKAVEGISLRYPVIKELVDKGDIKNSVIYKVKAKSIKFSDYTKSPREVLENI